MFKCLNLFLTSQILKVNLNVYIRLDLQCDPTEHNCMYVNAVVHTTP